MKVFYCIFITLIVVEIASAQSSRITMIGNLDIPHGNSGTTNFSSCWGYVAPDGREYALLGTCNGTSIIDMNSDSLKEIQFIPGAYANYCLREMKTWKHYAYITTEGGGGTQIVDLSHLPDTAIVVNNFIYVDTSLSRTRTTQYSHTVSISNGYLYLNGCRDWTPFGGSVIFSLLDDPANPEFVTDISMAYFHDTYIRNDTMYAAAVYNTGGLGGLYIIDFTDKSYPYVMGRITYSGSGTHNSWVSLDSKYVFTTDEIGTTTHNLKIWDISQLPNFQRVAAWQADPASIVHNVFGRGHYLYIAHYTAGMAVVDIHDPTNPSTAGWYDSYPGESGGYAGCWNVYPYFPSGRWIGSDMQTGLYEFTFDSLKARKRSRLLSPQNNSTTPVTTFRWTSAANQQEDPHFYELHIRDTSSTIDSVYTTTDTSFTLSRSPIGSFSWYVLIRDENTEVSSPDTFHFSVSPTGVKSEQPLPQSVQLKQNYPNPFNPTTTIEFELATPSEVTLTIYDALGKQILTLLDNERLGAGKQEIVFNATGLPSGTYFYELTTAEKHKTKQMLLIK